MLFAARDYFQFRKRSGHWAEHAPHSIMGRAYLNRLPDAAIASLQPGDVVFCSYYDSLLSWLVSYLTSTEISHVAAVSGPGTIIHATLGGVVEEDVESLFAPGGRLLPCKLPDRATNRDDVSKRMRQRLGQRY